MSRLNYPFVSHAISMRKVQLCARFLGWDRQRSVGLAWRELSASLASIPGYRHKRATTLVVLTLGSVISMPSVGFTEIDEPAQFAALGVGSEPCTSFVKAVGKKAPFTEVDRQAMLSWAQGYLSFYNSVTEGTYDVTRGTGANALENLLLEFCRKNPRASLMNAVDELLIGGAEPSLLPKGTSH